MQFYIWVTVGPVTTIVIVLIGVLLTTANLNARCKESMDVIQAFLDKDANLRRPR